MITITTIIMAMLSASLVATTTTTCNQYCGSTTVLNSNVGPSGSVHESAYYFYNNTYVPSVYITSTWSSCPVQLTINGNSLTINGTVIAIDGSNSSFYINFQLTATNGSNPLLELQSNQYVANGGTIDPTQFGYYSLSQGTLTGYGSYQGVVLSVAEFMHPLMIGTGANGKNLNYGTSGWFSYTINGTEIQTDLNLDLNCYCDATITCSAHGTCNSADGSCTCASGYTGTNCNQCASGYYGYPNCVACTAATTCSGYGTCNGDCSCSCNTGYTGASCNQCASGYYGYPTCVACTAATTCSGYGSCNGNGSCSCNAGYAGTNCNQCTSGYYGYPTCVACNATTTCSAHGICTATGGCLCNTGYNGTSCNECSSSYSGYPNCTLTTGISGGVIISPTSTPVNNANIAAITSWCFLVAFAALFA